MMDYFFNRQTTEIVAASGGRYFNAQANLLNHIKNGYSVSIPTAKLLFSKAEDAAEQRIDPFPAVYSLYGAEDLHDTADNLHTIPLAVIVASNHHDKETNYREAVSLADGIGEWLLLHKIYSAGGRNYHIHSPIRVEPYKTNERYTIAVLIVTLEDRK